MAQIYAILIRKGLKTINDVPKALKKRGTENLKRRY